MIGYHLSKQADVKCQPVLVTVSQPASKVKKKFAAKRGRRLR